VPSEELYPGDIKSVLLSEDQIQARVAELGAQVGADYRETVAANDQDLLLVTVLKGAVFFVTDLARAIPVPTQLEFMAVSSYGSSTSSSGVVRILKDLDRDINDRDVLIVEDIVDSGLTLSWLLRNLATRHPRSLPPGTGSCRQSAAPLRSPPRRRVSPGCRAPSGGRRTPSPCRARR
jgi:hypoxanthine phosphoribosyltransferase